MKSRIEFDEISSVRGDALQLPFSDAQFDYVICSLFTHHFVDEQVVQILREMSRVARRRIFVIDLHRHPIAYFLYTTVGSWFCTTVCCDTMGRCRYCGVSKRMS